MRDLALDVLYAAAAGCAAFLFCLIAEALGWHDRLTVSILFGVAVLLYLTDSAVFRYPPRG